MSVVSGIMGADATEDAAKTQSKSADRATASQMEMFDIAREDQAPWREAGAAALETLIGKVEAGPGKFRPEEDPGFEFGYKNFIEDPILKRASATGKLGGGGTQKELTRYASDYASTKYDNFLDRWYQSLAPYQSIAGVGQTSASQSADQAIQTGRGIAETELYAGEARASGYINKANVYNQMSQNTMQGVALANALWGGGGDAVAGGVSAVDAVNTGVRV